jgi:hypothetical protein
MYIPLVVGQTFVSQQFSLVLESSYAAERLKSITGYSSDYGDACFILSCLTITKIKRVNIDSFTDHLEFGFVTHLNIRST